MPNRVLRESICTSASLAGLSRNAEVLFYRLIVQADDFGRYHADPVLVLGACFPREIGRTKPAQVRKWLAELARADSIQVYAAKGDLFLRFPNWPTYQRTRAAESKFPEPPSSADNGARLLSNDSGPLTFAAENRESRSESRETRDEVREAGIVITAADAAPKAEANGKPTTKPTDTQSWLLQEMQGGGSGAWESFTFGALVELNRDFGRPVVTTVLGHAKTRLVEEGFEPESPYPWMRAACEAAANEAVS